MPELSQLPPGLPPPAPPGKLSAEELVFGVGFKRDANGKPIEQGIGAIGHETPQHINALERPLKLAAAKDGDRAELKKLLEEILHPPEDMSPEQRAAQAAKIEASKAQEDKQDGRIKELEAKLNDQGSKLDAILAALAPKQNATPPTAPAAPPVLPPVTPPAPPPVEPAPQF